MNELIKTGFVWNVEVVDRHGNVLSSETAHNLIVTEGLTHMASVVYKGATQNSSWYIGIYEGNYTPVSGATAATIAAASTESTAYAESTRVLWASGAVTAGALDNTASKAEFTMNANKTIYGGFLVSASPKASTTGVLTSLIRFPSPKVLESGSVLRVTTGVAFTSA